PRVRLRRRRTPLRPTARLNESGSRPWALLTSGSSASPDTFASPPERDLGSSSNEVFESLDDRAEHDSGSVGQTEFVVAGGQAPPLLHVAVAALDNVAAAVGLHVEAHGASAA